MTLHPLVLQQIDDPAEVAERPPVRPAPRFALFPGEEPQYFFFIESEVLCICHSFSHALMVWFMSHYVEYSVKIQEVALFVQEYIFGLPATSGLKRHKLQHTLLFLLIFKVICTLNDAETAV